MTEEADKQAAIQYISSISGLTKEQTNLLLERIEQFDQQASVSRLLKQISSKHMLKLLFSAVESAHDMIMITDAPDEIGQEKIIYVNRGMTEITGYSREELLGSSPKMLRGPDTEQDTIDRLRTQLAEGQSFEGETFNYRKDGSRYRVRWSIDPVYNDRDEITHFIAVQQDITAQWEQRRRLEQMLEERDSLLSEIHHRVKNNLAVISGLLELQSAKTKSPETRAILEESINRIQSIATLHEKLYETGDFSDIALPRYISGLLDHLMKTMDGSSGNITLEQEIVDAIISVEQAVPLALILNELVTNALKHAFDEGEKGRIRVQIENDDGFLILNVSDNGSGMPDELEIEELNSLGLRLIDTLSKQLGGEYHFEERDTGTFFTLRFNTA
ncbi:MAG: histidine kinase dimerization/phosphoacceptor domain -containing protein [Balneolaceae bacterium]|nr:histidine kinase dimerization/phosphoacceptor domain -containing protein [Balneolaceae bacterium]